MSDKNDLAIRAIASGAIAELNEISLEFENRDSARRVYMALLQIAKQMSIRHDFAFHRKFKLGSPAAQSENSL